MNILPHRHRAPLALLFGLCLLFWSRVLFTGQVLLPGAMLGGFAPFGSDSSAPWTILQWDALAQYFPWRHFAATQLQSGQIPLWNPYQFAGTPFLANAQSGVFYPLNFPFWLFDTAWAFGFSALIHSLLAAISTYFLAQRWNLSRASSIVAAAVYAFCGYLAAWALLPTLFATASWLPLCLLLFEKSVDEPRSRGAAWFLAIALCCALLAGHAQIFFYILLALLLRNSFLKHPMRGFGVGIGAVSLALALGAAQVLPTLELAQRGHRVGGPPSGADWQFQQTRALNFADWPSLVVPSWPMPWGSLNENFGYLGIGALLLALAGIASLFNRKSANASSTKAEVGETSYGASPTNVSSTKDQTPQTNVSSTKSETPETVAPVSSTKPFVDNPRARYFAFTLAIFGLLYALATPLAQAFFFAIPGVSQMGGPGRALLLWSLGAALLAGFGLDWARSRFQLSWLAPLVLLIVVGEGAWNAYQTQPTAPRSQIYPRTGLTDFLKSRSNAQNRVLFLTPRGSWLPTEGFRAPRTHPAGVLPPNGATVYGLHDVNGYDSLSIGVYRKYIAGEERGGASPALNGNMVLLNNPQSLTLDSLSVRYVVAPQELPLAKPPGRLVWSGDGCRVWERTLAPASRVDGSAFYAGWRNGKYAPETFRFGVFVSLCALGLVAANFGFRFSHREHRGNTKRHREII